MPTKLFICGFIIFLMCSGGLCNIHRTLSGNSKHRPRVKFPDELIEEIEDDDEGWRFFDHIFQKSNIAWFCSIPAAILVGSTGVLPLLIFTSSNYSDGGALSDAISPSKLKLLLSFSVGGLFGDVFLHLLPESWMYIDRTDHYSAPKVGMWIIAGLICFLLIEKIFSIHEKMNDESSLKMEFEDLPCKESEVDQVDKLDPQHFNKIGSDNELVKRRVRAEEEDAHVVKEATVVKNVQVHRDSDQGKRIMGYLNLLANCIDNFTHGLAVSGSFVVSIPVGVCTTFAILLHEIPHEIGDFAILLRAGFSRWEAAKGQVVTASGALLGCLFGLLAESAGDASSWVLPFTSGGFIYISCTTILPDLVQETSLMESLKQMVALFMGIGVMAMVSFAH